MTSAPLNLVCVHCLAVNRVPPSRLHDGPICGQCRHRLAPAQPLELTDQSFDKVISRSSLPVLVDFWAAWCGPCRMMAPAFAEAAEQLAPETLLAKLDTDAAPQSAGRFSITGIPTLILFHHGRELARQSGVLDRNQIVDWVRRQVGHGSATG